MTFLLCALIGSALIALLLKAVSNLYTGYQKTERGEKPEKRRSIPVLALLAIILIISFVLVPFSFYTVNTGEVAVVKEFGRAKEVKQAGLCFDFWLVKSRDIYDTKVKKMGIEAFTYSSDAQTMDVSMTVQYQIKEEKALEIAKTYGNITALHQKIKSIATEKVKAVLSSYKAMYIIANRAAMSPEVEKSLKKSVEEKYFVTINAVVITNIDFSDAFETAVENKMIAEQKQLKAEYENKTKIEKAQANAKAKIITAKAQKEANELLQKSLTDEILREKWITKWNGKTPSVLTDDSGLMIDLGTKK